MAENFFGITDTGRQRTNNEDAFIAEKVISNQHIMACVIDGVGGYEGGEVAAGLAKETILKYFSIPSGEVRKMMQEALVAANEKIQQEKLLDTEKKNMACVATLALVDLANNKFQYAHVGDTRLYLFRDNSLVKITKDHSFVGFLEDTGRLSEEAAMTHPKRNEITKALGFDGQIGVVKDYIEIGESPFLPGDVILLCSDGLTDMINKSEITSILQSKKTLSDKGKALVEAANNRGGNDNITVVLVENTAKAMKQTATKPVAVKKKGSTKKGANRNEQENTEVNGTKRSTSSRTAIIILSILCAGLLIALTYFFVQTRKKDHLTGVSNQSFTTQAISLADTLNRMSGDTLLLTHALFGNAVPVSMLTIEKDSLYLKGSGSTAFVRDTNSAVKTPALVILSTVKYLVFDSVSLNDVGIYFTSDSTTIHFKDVQFRNSKVYFGKLISIPDTIGYTGTLTEFLHLQNDSLRNE